MASHLSIPAWRIPWTEDSGLLEFIGSPNRVRQDLTKTANDIMYIYLLPSSVHCTWNNRLIPNRKRTTSRLNIVTMLI